MLKRFQKTKRRHQRVWPQHYLSASLPMVIAHYILLSAMLREGPLKGVREEPNRLTFDLSGRVISSSFAPAVTMAV